jgi:hypothetical protein
LNGPKFVDHLHSHQRDSGSNGRESHREGDASKAFPWSYSEATAGFQLTATADAEAFSAEQENIGIGAQGHDQYPPTQSMNSDPMDAAQIHERCSEKVRRAGEWEQLGNPKKASAWKAAIGEEPAVCGAKYGSEARGA